ncbi:SCO family protein [Psychroserpens ponticola]|uniref:SCO family protein n=1 Tax=Psychroserpens ponticola TaxID=2932268 RepID=A0ABY7S056_9FLAO|nr:SCO family protein [Psychroserpens ponticola]WCO02768.1 SCO family protein [Psychroserpens ponticola]
MTNFKLLVCSLFLLVLNCNTSSKELPILSYKIDATGNQRFYNMTYQGFTNQLGDSFSTEDIQNKICIANFFFTRCPSICPPMRTELISIAEAFSVDENILLISHTIDPKHDSIPVLKGYSEATAIPDNKWQFIRASEEKTKLQAEMYMTNFKPNEDGSDFYHSSFAALVDQKQQIRGFYNVLVLEDVERLKIDIKQLLK